MPSNKEKTKMTSVTDIIVLSIIVFAVAIILGVTVIASHNINTQILTVPTFNDSTPAKNVINSADTAIDYTDYIYMTMFIGFFLSILITGYFISGIPIAAPIYFFVVIFFTFISIIFQYVWYDLMASSSLVSIATYLPITNFIVSHLAYFMAVFGLAGILIMFAKPTQVGY